MVGIFSIEHIMCLINIAACYHTSRDSMNAYKVQYRLDSRNFRTSNGVHAPRGLETRTAGSPRARQGAAPCAMLEALEFGLVRVS
jgi:hypothetical protein